MRGREHFWCTTLVVGLATYGMLRLTGAPAESLALDAVGIGLLAGVGALLPDIDHRGSQVAKSGGWRTRSLATAIQALCGHRALTHSVIAALLFTAVLWPLLHLWALPLGVGYVAHLLQDMGSGSGVPLLWPHPRRYTWRSLYRTLVRAPRRTRRTYAVGGHTR